MGSSDQKNIEFVRQTILQITGRPQPAIGLFPLNSGQTRLYVQIAPNASVIAIRYVAATTTNNSISFVGKSVETIVQEINQLGIPLRAVTLNNIEVLAQGDFIDTSSNYLELPYGFTAADRLTNKGIVLRSKKVSVKQKDRSNIKLLSPYFDDPSVPWYPRIKNGSFTQKYNNKVYHFSIPEFDTQAWSLTYGKPFKDLKGVEPLVVDEGVYQLPRFPVYWRGENLSIYSNDIPVSSSVVNDIDVNNGLLYLKTNTPLADGFTVDYTYLETSYIYKGVNINGHFTQNPSLLDKFVVLYLLPIEGYSGPNKRSVYHAIGDSIEQAIDSISVTDPTIPIAILGAYSIQPTIASDKVSILDTRSKGGGLIESKGPTSPIHYVNNPLVQNGVEIESLYPEAYRFYDIGNWDGEAYPGAAAVSIDLPLELEDILPVADIKKKASKFLAAGVYPLLNFSERELPCVTGYSSQVSAVANEDLEFAHTGSGGSLPLHATLAGTHKGAGWLLDPLVYPSSVHNSGAWSSFNPTIPVSMTEGHTILSIGTATGVVIPYLKSTPISAVAWEERTVTYNTGSLDNPVIYSRWTPKKIVDTRACNSGELIKGYFYIQPDSIPKEIRNIEFHCPYHYDESLEATLERTISNIIDNTLSLQGLSLDGTANGTSIVNAYTNINDRQDVGDHDDYVLSPTEYDHLFDLKRTPLESVYSSELDNIGFDFLHSGSYNSGHYFKYYIQNIRDYVEINSTLPYAIFGYNQALKTFNGYLNYRYLRGVWSGDCDSGASTSSSLVTTLMSSSGLYGDFGPGVPIYWYYFPAGGSTGVVSNILSGSYIPSQAQLTGSVSEISLERNLDSFYTTSLPAICSSVISQTGNEISASLASGFTEAYRLAVNSTINTIESGLYATRKLSGVDTTTHWATSQNRLSRYLGNTVKNLTETYEYFYEYNRNRTAIDNVASPTGASPDFLLYIFSGIEKVLNVAYDAVYNNTLRGGIVEPDMAYTLYGYGWYLNNFDTMYGIRSKTYSNDYRDKFSGLFYNGLTTLLKSQFTEEGELYETTCVANSVGPFGVNTPSKILYPLAEGLKHNYNYWKGLAQGTVKTIENKYSISGLYYNNPYRQDEVPGKEYDILPGFIKMYKALAETGAYDSWEVMSTGLNNLRGTNFWPALRSSPDWNEQINSLYLWKNYHTGDVSTQIGYLRDYGINTLRVQLDYLYWKQSGSDFYNKLDHLLDTAASNRLRVIPVLFQGYGYPVYQDTEATYMQYGVSGGPYSYYGLGTTTFMTGMSGEAYVSGVVSRFDKHPAILAWDIINQSRADLNTSMNINACAYIIDRLSTTPIIASTDYILTRYETIRTVTGLITIDDESLGSSIYGADDYGNYPILVNPRIDFIGLQPYSLMDYSIDFMMPVSGRDYIITNLGEGTYADYEIAIERAERRNLPYVLSSLTVLSGGKDGCLYYDNTSRSARQVNAIKKSANEDGVDTDGVAVQRRNFDGFSFYPTGYKPMYFTTDLVNEVKSWNSRAVPQPLTNYNTGEFYRQADILATLHSGIDLFNYKHYDQNSYYVPQIYDAATCYQLNYYRSAWTSGNFFFNPSYAWTSNGSVDAGRYESFISAWGNLLGSICNRLDING